MSAVPRSPSNETAARAIFSPLAVLKAAEDIATYRDEHLAVVVEVEHAERTAGADAPSSTALRVTSVYRLEGDVWKLVHRHADPITTAR